MRINAKKSEIVHVSNYQKACCTKDLYCCNRKLAYAANYKYLGYIINETLAEKTVMEALTASATRAFGKVVNIFKKLTNMGINSYETLYSTYIVPIMNYAARVWGFAEYDKPQTLQKLHTKVLPWSA